MKKNPHWQVYHLIAADKSLIAEVRIRGTRSETESTAHLIDAAPDLLEALHEIETIVNESASECRKRMGTRLGNILVAARAAIAKAEGR